MDKERIEEELLATDPGGAEAQETEEERYQRLEAELRSELEAEADRRVTEALKTVERKHNKERKAEREAKLEEEKKAAQEQTAQNALREHELNIKENRLDLIDIISELDIPGKFRELIPVDDIADMEPHKRYKILRDRVIDLWAEFRKLTKKVAKEEMAKYSR